MKYILLISIYLVSVNCFAAPYLIEDHLKFLSGQKKSKRWSIKDAFTSKKTSGKKTSAPIVSVLPRNIKKNQKYEFSFGLEYGNLNLDIDGVKDWYEVYRASITAYARFLGVVGNFYLTEDSKENLGDVALSLRLVGSSQQTTHLSLFYGVNKTKEIDAGVLKNVNNYIWGGELMLYFIDILGASYHLTHTEENTESDISLRRSGRRHEIRVFLDYNYFRIFGSHVLEKLDYRNSSVLTRKESQGIMGGIKLFF